ncbi:MAG: NADP-dependent oxidoreductase [Acidobacteriota bacterium]|nr:NADP-dependent oxidoreductase [Acidobacteriota bacterium]
MPRAVMFEQYGGVEVLDVVEVEPPQPGDGQMVVRVRATGINPFEAKLRSGVYEGAIPVSFPAAQGNDFAGVVEQLGANVEGFAVGDEVFGTTARRGSQAELALAVQGRTLPRPAGLPWEVAGGLWTVGTTAYAAVAAVAPGAGDLVVVAGAAGGVGGLAAQLARVRGASVIGVASEGSHDWLRSRGIVPVAYDAGDSRGDGLGERLRQAAADAGAPLSAMIEAAGNGYVALAVELGIAPQRIDTVVDSEAAAEYGARGDGAQAAPVPQSVAELAQLIVAGELELPVAASFPLERVRDAYTLLEAGHPPGKIVLLP